MLDLLNALILSTAPGVKLSLWGALSFLFAPICKGCVQCCSSKVTGLLLDRYWLKPTGSEGDVCKERIDKSRRTLSEVDWKVMECPVGETPFSLNLRSTNVTDQDLIERLAKQKLLRKLDIISCNGITYKGVKKFKKLRPDCKVYHSCLPTWIYFLVFVVVSALMGLYILLEIN